MALLSAGLTRLNRHNMFNSYVHEKQEQTATARSRRELEGEKAREKEGKMRTELAQRYKQRLDQELVKVQIHSDCTEY